MGFPHYLFKQLLWGFHWVWSAVIYNIYGEEIIVCNSKRIVNKQMKVALEKYFENLLVDVICGWMLRDYKVVFSVLNLSERSQIHQ